METTLILAFLGASVLLTIMPGPDNIFVLTESLTKGKRDGIAISLGLALGIIVHTTAAATGLSLIIQKSALAFSIIKYCGALYLLYLAFQAYHEKTPLLVLKSSKSIIANKSWKLIRKGFFMNVLNPKVSLFFIAFLPQFLSTNGFDFRLQMIILGLIFMIQALIIFSLIAILSGYLTAYLNSPAFWKTTKWSKVVVLSLLGLSIGLSQR